MFRLMLVGLSVLLFSAQIVAQSEVYVFQESAPGVGDFTDHPIGVATAFVPDDNSLNTVQAYNYGSPASYRGVPGLPEAMAGVYQLFFVDAADGLSLFGVINKAGVGGKKGDGSLKLVLDGDDAGVIVSDDGAEVTEPNNNEFLALNLWANCCTDGFAIGTLEGDWTIEAQFLKTNSRGGPSGINNFLVASNDLTVAEHHLILEVGRRIVFSTVDLAILDIAIDVKPGSDKNPLNGNGKGKGSTPVAVLGSDVLDARDVDRSTVSLEGVPALSKGGGAEDVNGDGLLDVVMHFETSALTSQLGKGTQTVCLTGETIGGVKIQGCDTVNVK